MSWIRSWRFHLAWDMCVLVGYVVYVVATSR